MGKGVLVGCIPSLSFSIALGLTGLSYYLYGFSHFHSLFKRSYLLKIGELTFYSGFKYTPESRPIFHFSREFGQRQFEVAQQQPLLLKSRHIIITFFAINSDADMNEQLINVTLEVREFIQLWQDHNTLI